MDKEDVMCVWIYIQTYNGIRGLPLIAQIVKNLPAMQETWVQTLGWEDPLEKQKATHSYILTWTVP